jgi:trans-aconitate methyltransferase
MSTSRQGSLDSYYDTRYAAGYLASWPRETAERVCFLVSQLPLPADGLALDFGCGTGVLTQVLADTLRGWEVHGTDISRVALGEAAGTCRRCSFFTLDELEGTAGTYGLIFTHHVFEHVEDLSDTLDAVSRLLSPDGVLLSILPCGNEGSFEHALAACRRGGVDASGRFFFEDPSHLRRLTSADMVSALAQAGLHADVISFRVHHESAVENLTRLRSQVVWRTLTPHASMPKAAVRRLRRLRLVLALVAGVRQAAFITDAQIAKGHHSWTRLMIGAALAPIGLVGLTLDDRWRARAIYEWLCRSEDPRGSEMTVVAAKRADDW